MLIKICGLSQRNDIDVAIDAGANMLGFVFFPPSPRHVSPERAGALTKTIASRVKKVALVVNADDSLLRAIIEAMNPDFLQLHGSETPERAADIRARFGMPLIKALGVSDVRDLDRVPQFSGIADMLLFDAKPPKDATRPGGNGLAFDWSLLANLRLERPWLLSGGLNADNVAAALAATGAPGVDVSSGVESAPGVKDPDRIRCFVRAAGRLPNADATG